MGKVVRAGLLSLDMFPVLRGGAGMCGCACVCVGVSVGWVIGCGGGWDWAFFWLA